MKATELMAGNYLSYNGQIIKVANITNKKVGYHIKDNECRMHYARLHECKPIPLTPEILEKNGLKKDAFTNLSPDYYYSDEVYSIFINLNSTCDKSKSIWVENRNSRVSVSIEESRHSLDKKPLYVHELQHALKLCGIEKEIIL